MTSDRHARLAAKREARKTVSEDDLEAALRWVDATDLVSLLQEFTHLKRGRNRTLSLEAFLAGAYLCSGENSGAVILEKVTDILYFRATPDVRQRLDILDYSDDDRGFEAAYAVVRRLYHAIIKAVNPSPLPSNGHLSREEAALLTANADQEKLAERAFRLDRLCGLILRTPR